MPATEQTNVRVEGETAGVTGLALLISMIFAHNGADPVESAAGGVAGAGVLGGLFSWFRRRKG